ncbi:hypothetical protein GCK32_009114 [Trichostrongylus colubriformis]|uniref:Uncharacterized protein n=1 Tax=Trichostrongylus colubriformis TaxID=6319 RepID=A0AAN8F929_TRICO
MYGYLPLTPTLREKVNAICYLSATCLDYTLQVDFLVIFADDDSVKIRGQLNVIDEGEDISSGAVAEEYDDKIFDELPSLRIAREYLRQKIAEERQQKA